MPKRYDLKMVEDRTGDYVECSDYADLENKCDDLEDEIRELKNEVYELKRERAEREKEGGGKS